MSGNGDARYDFHVSGESVSCTADLSAPFGSVDSYEETFTGTLSGLTTHQRYPDESDRSCIWTTDTSDPITYVFSLDGAVAMRGGPGEVHSTPSGSCTGSEASKGGPWESSDKWSVIG